MVFLGDRIYFGVNASRQRAYGIGLSKTELASEDDFPCPDEHRDALGLEETLAAEIRDIERQQEERIRATAVRLAQPTLRAAQDLHHRIDNILDRRLHAALRDDYRAPADWSMTHRYAMTSTLYLFAKYFACVVRARSGVGEDVFEDVATRQKFFAALLHAGQALSSFPLGDLNGSPRTMDAHIFNLDQAAMGEAITLSEPEAIRSTLSYHEFTTAWQHLDSHHLHDSGRPAKEFLAKVSPDSRAGERLRIFGQRLEEVVRECRSLLSAET